METKQKRLPRDRNQIKPEELPRFRLTPRDIEILIILSIYRILDTVQIEALLFNPAMFVKLITNDPKKRIETRCKKRLQILYLHGFVDRVERPILPHEGKRPYLYLLTQKGINFLEYQNLIQESEVHFEKDLHNPSHIFLEHTLLIQTIRIAFTLAVRNNGWKITKWLDERYLKNHLKEKLPIVGRDGAEIQTTLVPDGYFNLKVGDFPFNFFIEVDRSSEVLSFSSWNSNTIAKKVRTYGSFFRPGPDGKSPYFKKFGKEKARVLFITTGEIRAANLHRLITQEGGESMYWVTSLPFITPETILTSPIWYIASQDGTAELLGPYA